jgi:hypothetical protein
MKEVGNMQTMQYLTEKETANLTRKALSTLRNDRHLRRGIPYYKDRKSVRYSLNDIILYMETRKIKFEG